MNYQRTISAPVSASAAFHDINQVSGWWAKHVEGYTESLHDVFTVRFGTTWVTFEVTDMTPYRRIEWLVTDCYLPWLTDTTEWTGTRVVFEISDGQVTMTHHGLVPQAECYEQCERGWNEHFGESLSRFLTGHVGMPV